MNIMDAVYRILDSETTGADPATAGVIEVAWMDIDARGSRGLAFNAHYNPGKPIEPEASAAHRIVDEEVAGKPHVSKDMEAISSAMHFVAHNAPYDRTVLGLDNDGRCWIDTYRMAKHLYEDLSNFNLQVLRYSVLPREKILALQELGAHEALADVEVLAALFLHMLPLAAEKWGEDLTVEQLAGNCKAPVLLKRIGFSDHKGKLYQDVDYGMLKWIVQKNAGSPDDVYTAQHWMRELGRRGAFR